MDVLIKLLNKLDFWNLFQFFSHKVFSVAHMKFLIFITIVKNMKENYLKNR